MIFVITRILNAARSPAAHGSRRPAQRRARSARTARRDGAATPRWFGRGLLAALLLIVAGLGDDWGLSYCRGQDPPGLPPNIVAPLTETELARWYDLRDQVTDGTAAERDAALAAIRELGPAILPWLPSCDPTTPELLRDSWQKLHAELAFAEWRAWVRPALLDVDSPRPLTEHFAVWERQSGTRLQIPGEADGTERWPLADRSEFRWADSLPVRKPFWEVLLPLARDRGWIENRSPSQAQTLEFRRQPREAVTGSPSTDDARSLVGTTLVADIVALTVDRLEIQAPPSRPDQPLTRLVGHLMWEPRLQPIEIRIPQSSWQIVDDRQRRWEYADDPQVTVLPVQPTQIGSELSLNWPQPVGPPGRVQEFRGGLHLLIAGPPHRFQFPTVDQLPAGWWVERGQGRIVMEGIRRRGEQYSLKLLLVLQDPQTALESHHSWMFYNHVELVGGDGRRVRPLRCESYRQAEDSVGLIYWFDDIPWGSTLIYHTPTQFGEVEIAVTFPLHEATER